MHDKVQELFNIVDEKKECLFVGYIPEHSNNEPSVIGCKGEMDGCILALTILFDNLPNRAKIKFLCNIAESIENL